MDVHWMRLRAHRKKKELGRVSQESCSTSTIANQLFAPLFILYVYVCVCVWFFSALPCALFPDICLSNLHSRGYGCFVLIVIKLPWFRFFSSPGAIRVSSNRALFSESSFAFDRYVWSVRISTVYMTAFSMRTLQFTNVFHFQATMATVPFALYSQQPKRN